jgi:hypothetical protein
MVRRRAKPGMKIWFQPVLTALCAGLVLSSCQHGAEKAATAAAQTWLVLIDAGNYSQSWTVAAAYLQRVAAEPQWEASMNRVRKPLGRLLSRQKKSAKETTTALGDRCVIIEYDTAFENKSVALETVTVMPAKDGPWKVAGYFIK